MVTKQSNIITGSNNEIPEDILKDEDVKKFYTDKQVKKKIVIRYFR